MSVDDFIRKFKYSKLSIDKIIKIKKYIKIEDKLRFYDEYVCVFNDIKDKYQEKINFIMYIYVCLMIVKYYTNLDIDLTLDEYDKLQEDNLINSIIDTIGSDLLLLYKVLGIEG